MNFHWSILSTNLKHCCPTKMRQTCDILPELHWRINCCHTKMTQTCSIFAKIAVKKSKVVSPWIFIGAFFQQTWNIVVLQRNHFFVVRKRPFFPAPNPRKQPQQHFIISLCKNLVVFASILFSIFCLNLPSRTSLIQISRHLGQTRKSPLGLFPEKAMDQEFFCHPQIHNKCCEILCTSLKQNRNLEYML